MEINSLSNNTLQKLLAVLADAGINLGSVPTSIGEQKNVIVVVDSWDDTYNSGTCFIAEYDWETNSWISYEGGGTVADINGIKLVVGNRYFAKWNGETSFMTNEPVGTCFEVMDLSTLECVDGEQTYETKFIRVLEVFDTEEECTGYGYGDSE